MTEMSLCDLVVLIVMFLLVTVGAHFLAGGMPQRVSDFFKGDNKVPWWAVSASVVATKISALTFIALPAKVFVDGGNLEYAVAISGFVLGNFLMAFIFVRPYYVELVYPDKHSRDVGDAQTVAQSNTSKKQSQNKNKGKFC